MIISGRGGVGNARLATVGRRQLRRDVAHAGPAIPLTMMSIIGYFHAVRAIHLLWSDFAVQPDGGTDDGIAPSD